MHRDKKGDTYLNKTAAKRSRLAFLVCVSKGLSACIVFLSIDNFNHKRYFCIKN